VIFTYNDGCRAAAGYTGKRDAGDCATRPSRLQPARPIRRSTTSFSVARIRGIAEQLTAVKRRYRIVGHALIKYLRGQQLRPPPPLQHAQPCPVRLKTAFGARMLTHGFSFIGARLSQTVVLWPSNRYRCSGTYVSWICRDYRHGGRTI
jgi:hypothetical protein